MANDDMNFKDYCTKERLQDNVPDEYTIDEFKWNGETGEGIITVVKNNEKNMYNFALTLTNNGTKISISVSSYEYELQDTVKE